MRVPRRLTVWPVLIALVLASGALSGAQSARTSQIIDARALLRDAQVLSSDEMQGRQVGTAGGARAREYVVSRFKEAGVQPFGESYTQPFTFTAGRRSDAAATEGVNVVGRIDGSRSTSKFIVVSAHYDHVGVANGQVYNGADDNASGTAALIAVAKYFHDHRPQHSIVVAAFDGEERGLRGSRAFVDKPPVDRGSIVIDVNIDMIGRDPEGKLFAVGTFLNPFLKPYLQRVAATTPVKLLLGHDDPNQKNVEDWTKDSDHWAFQQAGIPAVYVGDEDFEHHHKPTDDFDTLTYDFFIGATETCVAVVREFDGRLEEISSRK